ncbi:DEKNAAC102241 [Brettanomyces naardenensis]|uniref:DEKNAAC102242 n=1 Tax=Brettanomyces naardenensis TaxID=13370 RepID=A0A448YLF5_BRENA|nr:DEKNAAC102241 [Brettanomyces naardenensis]
MSTYTFKWPKGPKSVTVTGDFDNWSKQCPLVEQPDGSFEATFPVPSTEEKIQFKFVIDDDKWLISDDYKTETDVGGNVNNVIYQSDLKAAAAKSSAFIPESGGLPVPVFAKKTLDPGSSNFTPAVEPRTPKEPNPETEDVNQSQATAAVVKGPGIVIPENPEAISAFTEVRDVDPKTLNEVEEPAEAAEVAPTAAEVPAATTTSTSAAPVPATTPKEPKAPKAPKETKEPKYVKKVVKKVKKEATDATEAAKKATSKAKTSTPAPKEKKGGFLSKLKKVFA